MNRTKSLLALSILSALAAACGSSDGGDPYGPLVKVLYPVGGLGDRSFSDMVYTGVVRADLEAPFQKVQISPINQDEAVSTMKTWLGGSTAKPELIITVGQSYTSTLKTIACPAGERYLLHLDDFLPACPNTVSVTYRTFAPSFQAGVAAMAVSKRKTAAIIGGMDLPTVNTFMMGFKAGVEHVGGTVVSIVYLASDETGFNSPEKAGEAAEILYTDADVIFPVAGASGSGVFEAAKAGAGRYAIGVDTDQSWLGRKVIIGSVIKRLDNSAENVIREFLSGTLAGGELTPGLDDGGTEFVVSDQFIGQVKEAADGARAAALDAEKRYLGAGR